VRRYGKGPAILMVHGFPRTSLMWRFLAPKLAENHTVIYVDLRAYGRSGIPASTDDHFPYSKRAMAKELVDVMVKLGFPTFTLIGHVEHDRADKKASKRIECRMLHLWAEGGPLDNFYARDGGPLGTPAFRSVRERSGVHQVTKIGSVVTRDVPLTDLRQEGERRRLGLAGDDLGQHLLIGILEPHTRERRDHLGDCLLGGSATPPVPP
jgi:hypothetical protein